MSDAHDPKPVVHLPGSPHADPLVPNGEHGHHEAMHGGSHGIAKYVYVFVALCLLTTCSFMTYSEAWPYHDRPAVGRSFMLIVSSAKALLVILFFMHLKYEAAWKWVLTVPASVMSLFLLAALIPDIGMRVRRYSEERRELLGTRTDAQRIENASAALHPHEDHADDHADEHGAAPAHGH
ncbi:MAG TPA: cytochrome C oxidase subunit IV family protein [Pirellulales bacterium]|jgi:cytochrome c oxidase subunit 4|nr:cytochrome C oxidase subunit IV family protein [Pirellulales bacterium]